jgi:ATP/maltotriose-dependent transcriptional regulator MalT
VIGFLRRHAITITYDQAAGTLHAGTAETAKTSTHIRSIYAKLGAADRSAAVRCACDLRLLAVLRS